MVGKGAVALGVPFFWCEQSKDVTVFWRGHELWNRNDCTTFIEPRVHRQNTDVMRMDQGRDTPATWSSTSNQMQTPVRIFKAQKTTDLRSMVAVQLFRYEYGRDFLRSHIHIPTANASRMRQC